MATAVAVALQSAAGVAATHSNIASASSSAAATATAAAAEGEFVPQTFVAVSWNVSLRTLDLTFFTWAHGASMASMESIVRNE
jgi:hypothetical protein